MLEKQNRDVLILSMDLDLELWQKLYNNTQQEYLRKRLRAIKYLYEGKMRPEIAKIIGCTYKTLTTWIDLFLNKGLEALVTPVKHNVKQRLSPQQKIELKEIIINKLPSDYGIDRNIWTGKIIAEVIYKQWSISYKLARIYEILYEIGLSHQRAHRDYINADSQQQKDFVQKVEKTLDSLPSNTRAMFYDEFAVFDRPSIFYGWAEKNTRPKVPSDEKKRNKTNGFLSVDAVTGEEHLVLHESSKSEDIASYFLLLCAETIALGYSALIIFLDNNSTHKEKMITMLNRLLSILGLADKITVEFVYTASYSPKLNLAEYLIHQLRLRLLHHIPIGTTIEMIVEKVENFFQHNQLQTPEQIYNTMQHIYGLAA